MASAPPAAAPITAKKPRSSVATSTASAKAAARPTTSALTARLMRICPWKTAIGAPLSIPSSSGPPARTIASRTSGS